MKTILVIGDEDETLDNLVLTLEMEGFTVMSTADGRAGITLAKLHKPDVILCEVAMPGVDGQSVLQALRADSTTVSIPFICLTAGTDKQDPPTGMNLGADDYLTKPARAEEVMSAIRTLLDRHQEKGRQPWPKSN